MTDILHMRKRNNGQKVDFAEIDAGGGPETGILLGVALWISYIVVNQIQRMIQSNVRNPIPGIFMNPI